MTTSLKYRALRVFGVVVPALVAAGLSFSAAAPERHPARRMAFPDVGAVETGGAARVIVKYRGDANLMRPLAAGTTVRPLHAAALSTRLGLALSDGRQIGDRAQVLHGQGLASQALADRLAAQPDVEYAVVDQRMQALAAPNDPLYPAGQTGTTPAAGQWYLRAPTGSTIADPVASLVSPINAEAAWNITTGSSSIVVAVVDSGVRRDHPDLASKLLPGYDFVSNPSNSNDGDGIDNDPSDPGSPVASTTASIWHGTETSGIVGAATNNGIGMAGVGRDVMVLPIRALSNDLGSESDVIAGMLWAAGLTTTPSLNPYPAKVVNLSLGLSRTGCDAAYQDAVDRLVAANVVVVVAAGNDGYAVGTPANCRGVLAVAGVRHVGTKVAYSDLGPEIAISAPAGNCVNSAGSCVYPIVTTSNSGTRAPVSDAGGGSIYTGGGSNASLGTSFAAPMVAGTVALMLSANPTLTVAQVTTALKASARPFPANGAATGVSACVAPSASSTQYVECYCTTSTCGAGLLDAGAAVAAVATVTANIATSSTAVTAGTGVTLDGSSSRSSTLAATITGYQWSLSGGSALATFTSGTNASTVTLLPSTAGTLVVTLTVTDSTGKQASSNVTLTVAAAAAPPVTTPTGGSSSGGGALEAGWLVGWLAAILAVARATPRRGCRRRD